MSLRDLVPGLLPSPTSVLGADGRKDDKGKWRFSLLPMNAILEVIDVLEYGAKKYAPDNWRKVPDWRTRYFDAAQRHILDWWTSRRVVDPDTNIHSLAHAVCCLLFILALELEQGEEVIIAPAPHTHCEKCGQHRDYVGDLNCMPGGKYAWCKGCVYPRQCAKCGSTRELNSAGWCIECFSKGEGT